MQNQKNNHKVSTLVKLLVLALAIFALTVVAFTACSDEEEVALEAITVASNPNTVTYNLGETFDCAGATIKVTYSDGTTKTVNVTKDMLADNSAFDEVGDQLVAVVYAEGGVQKVTYITVVVYDQLGEDKATAINGLAAYKADADRGVVAMYNDCVAAIEKAADAAAINTIVEAFKADVKAYTEAKAAALAEVASLYNSASSVLGGTYQAQADTLKASAEVVIANATTLADVNTALADYKLSLEAVLDDEVAYWELIATKEEIVADLLAQFTEVYGVKTHYYAIQQFMKLEDARDAAVAHILLVPYITEEEGDALIEDLMGELEEFDDYIDWAYQKWAEIGNVKYRPLGATNYAEDSKKAIDAAIEALLTALNNIDGENYTQLSDIVATDGDAYKSLIAYDEDLTAPVDVIAELNADVLRYEQLNTAYDVAVAPGGLSENLLGLLVAIGGTVDVSDIDAIEVALKAYMQWLIDYEMITLNADLTDPAYAAILDTILNADDATLYEYTKTATEDVDNSRGKMIGDAYTALNDVVVEFLGLLEEVRIDADEVIAAIDAIETKNLLAKRALIEAAEAAYKAWAEKYGISTVVLTPADMTTYGEYATLPADAFVETVVLAKLAGSIIVTNYGEMIDARNVFDALYAEAFVDAQEVLAKIDAINAVLFDLNGTPTVMLSSGPVILEAKAAYEAWAIEYGIIEDAEYADTAYTVIDEENKEDLTFITTYAFLKTSADEYKALYEQAVLDAKAVVDLIDAIGTVKFDLATDGADSLAAIVAAEEALAEFNATEQYTADGYDAATVLITAEKLQVLADARAAYEALKLAANAINDRLAVLAAQPTTYLMREEIESIYDAILVFTEANSDITSPLNLELFATLHEAIYYQVYHTNQINASEFVSSLVTSILGIIPDNNTYTEIRTAVNNAGNLYKGLIERYAYNYPGTDADALDAQIEEVYDILDDALNVILLNTEKALVMNFVASAISAEAYIKDAAEALLAEELQKIDAILAAYAAGDAVDATVNPMLAVRVDGVFPVIVADSAVGYADELDRIYDTTATVSYIQHIYDTLDGWINGYREFNEIVANLGEYMDALLAEMAEMQPAFDVYNAQLLAVEYVVTDDHDAQIEAVHAIFDDYFNVFLLNAVKMEIADFTENVKTQEPGIVAEADALFAEFAASIDLILDAYETGVVDATVNPLIANRTDAYAVLPLAPSSDAFTTLLVCYGIDDTHAVMVEKEEYEAALMQIVFDYNAANPNPDDDNEAGFPTNP